VARVTAIPKVATLAAPSTASEAKVITRKTVIPKMPAIRAGDWIKEIRR